jgi:hypothetical protein
VACTAGSEIELFSDQDEEGPHSSMRNRKPTATAIAGLVEGPHGNAQRRPEPVIASL